MLSCTNNKKNSKEQFENYTTLAIPIIEESFATSINIKNRNFLPLESNEINKISSINKILFFNSQILLFDQQQNKIILFNTDGKYLSQINNIGKGPNEYLYLSDFLINKTDSCIELLDRGNQKILRIDYSNRVINETKLTFYCDKFLKTEEGGYLFFANNQTNKIGSDSKPYNLILTDNNASILNCFLSIPSENQELIISESQTFVPYQTGVNFSLPIDDNIYFANADAIKIKYRISFGKWNTPQNILEPLKGNNQGDKIQLQMKIMNKIGKAGYAYNIHSILENESFLFFQFRKGMNVYSVIYDKKTKNVKSGVTILMNNDADLLGQPIALNNKNQLVTVLFPYELLDQLKTRTYPEFENLANSIDQFDNPILQFIQLSEF